MIGYHAVINGIGVDARYSEESVGTVFLPLLKRLSELRRQKGRRVIMMLAAPPGCGKTTLLSFLEKLWHDHAFPGSITVLGMDGFHRRQEYLLSHTVSRDGQTVPMVRIKGAPVTFDLERLTSRLEQVAAGENCPWPVYDRLLHNPTEDAVRVDGDIVLLEGNYLLLDEPGWRGLSAFADFTVSVTADESLLRSRLIARKIQSGADKEEAVRFVDTSDMPNVRLCIQKTRKADLCLRADENGFFRVG